MSASVRDTQLDNQIQRSICNMMGVYIPKIFWQRSYLTSIESTGTGIVIRGVVNSAVVNSIVVGLKLYAFRLVEKSAGSYTITLHSPDLTKLHQHLLRWRSFSDSMTQHRLLDLLLSYSWKRIRQLVNTLRKQVDIVQHATARADPGSTIINDIEEKINSMLILCATRSPSQIKASGHLDAEYEWLNDLENLNQQIYHVKNSLDNIRPGDSQQQCLRSIDLD